MLADEADEAGGAEKRSAKASDAVALEMTLRAGSCIGLAVLPFSLIMTYSLELAAKQLGQSVYFWANSVDIVTSLALFLLSSLTGELSQPERYGRKAVLIYLYVVDTLPLAGLCLTQDYRVFLVGKVFAAMLGGQVPNFAAIAVVNSWVTDWATEDQKIGVNSRIIAVVIACFAVAPLLSATLSKLGVPLQGMLFLVLFLKLMQPLFMLVVFPGTAATEAAARRNRGEEEQAGESAAEKPAAPGPGTHSAGPAASKERLFAAWRYLLYRHPRPLLVTLVMAAISKAFQKNQPLYLTRELGMTRDQLGLLITMSSFMSLAVQSFVVPAISRRPGHSPHSIVLLGTAAQMAQLIVAAVARTPGLIMATCWLGSLTGAADPVLTSVMSKCSATPATPGGQSARGGGSLSCDQGLIMGAVMGLKQLCGIFGELLVALLLTSAQPSYAFFALALCMLPATVVALQMLMQDLAATLKPAWVEAYAGPEPLHSKGEKRV